MDFYIYYHVRHAKAPILKEYVDAMQQELVTTYGIQVGLKRRPEVINEQHTWMEIYLGAPDNFDEVLLRTVQKFDLSPFIEGMRHVEKFTEFEL